MRHLLLADWITGCVAGSMCAMNVQAFEDMQASGCRPDGAVYSSIINALWCSGVRGPRTKAASLYSTAVSGGLFAMAVHVSIIDGVLEVFFQHPGSCSHASVHA